LIGKGAAENQRFEHIVPESRNSNPAARCSRAFCPRTRFREAGRPGWLKAFVFFGCFLFALFFAATVIGKTPPRTYLTDLLTAAGNRDSAAQFNLSQTYALGEGVPRDHEEVAKWPKRLPIREWQALK
jgi:TPR repeat protein